MNRLLSAPSTSNVANQQRSRLMIAGLRFDWMMVLLSAIFLGGLYLDGWAHNHGRVDESFFTIWHAFFYGGFALTALVLTGTILVHRFQGIAFASAIPRGYELSTVGLLVFGSGGAGDLVWHVLFGIEEDIEALFSPTHLLLGLGLALVVTGPLRAAWGRSSREQSWRTLGPAMLSVALLISTLTFFMMFAHPITTMIGGARHYHFFDDVGVMAGIMAFVVMAALLTAPILLLLRRWSLPLGSLTLIWGLNTVAMATLDYEHVQAIGMTAAMVGAAAGLDWLRWRLQIGPGSLAYLRPFAFLTPVFLFGAYYAVLAMTEGIGWSVHLWTGSLFLSGIAGLLLSYLLLPPAMPAEDAR